MTHKAVLNALLIIDHGSKRKAANHMLFDMVKLLREKRPALIIHGAHMELAAPTIEEGINKCIENGATHIIAHPYMLSPGRHATEDIPQLIKSILHGYPEITFEVTGPLGIAPCLVQLILERSNLL
jgi:sirohydrochlorin ferrochelatase